MEETVLIVDDDAAVLQMLTQVIKDNGPEVCTAQSGEEALGLISEKRFSAILLDINMRGIDGFTVLDTIRKQGIMTPVIIISGRKEDYDALHGLDIGADDYVTKPFNPVVLAAKVKALIRRTRGSAADPVLRAGDFEYRTDSLRLYKKGTEIPLSAKENALMKLFLDNPNRIFSKTMLYEMVWEDILVDENTITVYVNRLRKKIEDDPDNPVCIRTVRGLGYRFVP